MATDSLVWGGTSGHPANSKVKQAYCIERTIDIADWLTEKGSALAANDVLEVIALPAGTMLLGGGIEIVTAGNATSGTFDFGWGGSADVIADGVDFKTTGYGAAGSNGAVARTGRFDTADTLDVTLKTLSGTLAAGTFRVYAILVDVA